MSSLFLFTSCFSNFPSLIFTDFMLFFDYAEHYQASMSKTLQSYNQCHCTSPSPQALFSTLCGYQLFPGITIMISTNYLLLSSFLSICTFSPFDNIILYILEITTLSMRCSTFLVLLCVNFIAQISSLLCLQTQVISQIFN